MSVRGPLRRCVCLLLIATSGCADGYLIADATVESLARIPDSLHARLAIPAIRRRDHRPLWVLSDQVRFLAAPAAPGFRSAVEAHSRRRISPGGMTLVIVGAIGVSLGAVFAAAANSCASPGALPCLSSGDAAVPLFVIGGGMLFSGTGLTVARGVDVHPAEVTGAEDNLIFLHTPVEAPHPAKTPLE